MTDYEKECFMVQGFSSASSSTATSTNPSSEFVQEGQQGNKTSPSFCSKIIVNSLKQESRMTSSLKELLVDSEMAGEDQSDLAPS